MSEVAVGLPKAVVEAVSLTVSQFAYFLRNTYLNVAVPSAPVVTVAGIVPPSAWGGVKRPSAPKLPGLSVSSPASIK